MWKASSFLLNLMFLRMIDQAKKKSLIEHIKNRQLLNGSEILLSPDLYFDGYDDDHCSVCANVGPFSTSRFVSSLKNLGRQPDVSAIFVRFYDYADAIEFEDSWVGSDSIYILTSASLETVRDWFSELEATDVWEETDITKFPDITQIPCGNHLFAVWWD